MADLPSILLASSEVVGFAKTGGLADVAGYLPLALARRGHPVAVIMPLYRSVRNGKQPIRPTEQILGVPVGRTIIPARLWRSELPDSDVPVFLVENADFFERDDPARGLGIYQRTHPTAASRLSDTARFTFFVARDGSDSYVGFPTSSMRTIGRRVSCPFTSASFIAIDLTIVESARFTIHNIAFRAFRSTFSPDRARFSPVQSTQVEFYGHSLQVRRGLADWVNMLAQRVNEIRTPAFG
jgi:starch synthase